PQQSHGALPGPTLLRPASPLLPAAAPPATRLGGRTRKGGTASQTYTLDVVDAAAATLSGTLFDDANGDGVQQAGEPGQPGWAVFVDRDQSGRRDPGEWFALTDAGEAYTLSGVLPGSCTLRAERRVNAQVVFRQTVDTLVNSAGELTGLDRCLLAPAV